MATTRDNPAAPKLPSTHVDSAKRETVEVALGEPDMISIGGEGNYAAAKEFNDAEHQFVAAGKVAAAAQAAAPKSEKERREMIEAEKVGKRRARTKESGLGQTPVKRVTLRVSKK